MKTITVIGKVLDIVNKVLTVIGWVVCIATYSSILAVLYSYVKKKPVKKEEETEE